MASSMSSAESGSRRACDGTTSTESSIDRHGGEDTGIRSTLPSPLVGLEIACPGGTDIDPWYPTRIENDKRKTDGTRVRFGIKRGGESAGRGDDDAFSSLVFVIGDLFSHLIDISINVILCITLRQLWRQHPGYVFVTWITFRWQV